MVEFKERGRILYRDFLKEDMTRMKSLIEGSRYIGMEAVLEEYETLARQCLKWKRLIKLNK